MPNDPHGHSHGTIDPVLLTTQQGIAAIKWSTIALLITALVQFVIVLLSSSVALLADTIHNVGDAATGLPLWLAFVLARKRPTLRFTYGYGRAEDVAGILETRIGRHSLGIYR
jgi:divalent metal cation (Fe/Co/Zn/Cd) transporter